MQAQAHTQGYSGGNTLPKSWAKEALEGARSVFEDICDDCAATQQSNGLQSSASISPQMDHIREWLEDAETGAALRIGMFIAYITLFACLMEGPSLSVMAGTYKQLCLLFSNILL